jgi:outer membrane protein OmpA-like peptidoglycan-associated protein
MRPQSFAFVAVVALMGFVCVGGAPPAAAQDGFTLNRYRMPPTSDEGFGLYMPAPPPHLTLDLRLGIDYAYGSLAVSPTVGMERQSDERQYLVENTFATHFAASFGLADWFGVFVTLPVSWVQSGSDAAGLLPGFTPISGPAAGDFGIGLRAKFAGERERPTEGAGFALGVVMSVLVPSGVTESLASDGSVGFQAVASASIPTAVFTPIVNLGFNYRPEADYMGLLRTGSELTFGVGGHIHLDPVRLEAELRGAASFIAERDQVPLEVLLGAHFALGSGLTAGIAADFGITQAPGVPAVRMLGTFGAAIGFGGDDGGGGGGDGGGGGGGGSADDADGDGIPDSVDECPTRAEDADGIEDDDGCPEDDADGDGNPDTDDFCPLQPETINDYLDDDGCPDGAQIEGVQLVTSEPILFTNRGAALSAEIQAMLSLVAELLADHPEIALVQIEGHAAQNEGNTNRTLGLSEARAEAVVAYLVDQGVQAGRLTFVGMGADVPATAGEHDQNRRVTFRILERR